MLTCILAVSTFISACDSVVEKETGSTRATFNLSYETSHQVTTTATYRPEIRTCKLEDLSVTEGPGEGGAGIAFRSVAFHNTSSTRCRLVDPVGLEIVGKRFQNVEVTLQKPGPEPYDRPLEPGKRAVIEITHWKCPEIYEHPKMTKAFRVIFPKGLTLRVPFEAPANCGFVWYGHFSDWK